MKNSSFSDIENITNDKDENILSLIYNFNKNDKLGKYFSDEKNVIPPPLVEINKKKNNKIGQTKRKISKS